MGFSPLLLRQQQEHLSVLVQTYVFPVHHPIPTFSAPQHTALVLPLSLAVLPAPSIGESVLGVVEQQVFVLVVVAVVAAAEVVVLVREDVVVVIVVAQVQLVVRLLQIVGVPPAIVVLMVVPGELVDSPFGYVECLRFHQTLDPPPSTSRYRSLAVGLGHFLLGADR
jgi:hypothetical protein